MSFVFITPAVVLNGNTWDMIINHRGPDSVYDADILFRDDDQLGRLRLLDQASAADLEATQRLLHVPEVEPKGLGTIFARQFPWTPLDLDHEHYVVEVSSKRGRFHEDLYIERVTGEFEFALAVKDPETQKTLLTCRDPKFPVAVATEVMPGKQPCFPNITAKSF
jgi:hypothetical protein